MFRVWFRAFLTSFITFLMVVVITTPLAQYSGWERPGTAAFVMRVIGFTAIWLAEALLLVSPVLLILVASRVRWVRRGGVAVAGALLGIAPSVVRIGVQNGWNVLDATVRGVLAQPVLLVADWAPFLVSGAVLGYILARDWGRRHAAAS
jgi:hypothetical protein